MAAYETSSIYYNGYTYRVGDIIKINNNYLYGAISSTSPVTTKMLTETTNKIKKLWTGDEARNPIQVAWASGPAGSFHGGGCIRLDQIVQGSGGTPDTYTVKYNANGGTGAPSSQTKTYGVNLKLSSTIPTRPGYTFLGWSTSTDASIEYGAGATYTANAAVTLYAVWKLNTYPVIYNANGGTGAPGQQTKTYGKNLTLSSTKPTREGYTFVSWNTKADGTGTTYASGGTYSENARATLYAIWKLNTYTITFNASANGGIGDTTKTVTHGGKLSSLPEASKEFYKMLGWFTEKTGGTQITKDTVFTGSMTVYAQFKLESTLAVFDGEWNPGIPYVHEDGEEHQGYAAVFVDGEWKQGYGGN